MPKSTFYNLNIEKREKIEKAIRNEFGKKSFSKASISNIIEEANIPRGSFYQYFEDKEDAIKYVISNFIEMEKRQMKKILEENNGDIFETAIGIYQYIVDKNSDDQEIILCKNILQTMKDENINVFEEIRLEKNNTNSKSLINTTNLNVKNDEDIKYIMKIISVVVRAETIEVMSQRKSKEQGLEELKAQIKLLQEGLRDGP